MSAKWYEEVGNRVPVQQTAEALGLKVRKAKGITGFTCPIHGKDHSDGRPSGRIVHNGLGWKCWACGLGGTSVQLACYVLTGQRRPEREDWFGVRAWFAERGWCEPFRPGAHGESRPAPVAPVQFASEPSPEPEPPPPRLPADEVAALWASAWPVFTEVRADRWIRARSWAETGQRTDAAYRVASGIAALDLARAIPPGHSCPAWAGGERWSWGAAGWSLLLPCFDSEGRMAALRARWTGTERNPDDGEAVYPTGPVDPDDPSTYLAQPPPGGWADGPAWVETPPPYAGKEASPAGAGFARGVVYADPVAQWLLRGRRGAITEGSCVQWDRRILIVEGGPAWLRYATEPGRVREVDGKYVTHAVFGVWSGAWPAGPLGRAFAQRCRVADAITYAPDDDDGGDAILRPVRESLAAIGHTLEIVGGARG